MNALFTIELPWAAAELFKKMDPEKYAALREAVPPLELPQDQSAISEYYHPTVIGPASDIEALAAAGVHPTVKGVRGLMMPRELKETARALARGEITTQAMPPVQVTNITIPSAGLFEVTTVKVIEEACTDYLQRHLRDGWRIIAVCPARDTRRPDYILGHRDSDPPRI